MIRIRSHRINFLLFVLFLLLIFAGPSSLLTKSAFGPSKADPSSPDEFFATAKINYLNDNYDLSIQYFKQAKQSYIASKEYEKACNCLIYTAEAFRLAQNIPKARSALNESLIIAKANFKPNHGIFSDYYRTDGTIAYFEGNLNRSLESAKKSISIRRSMNIKGDTNLILPYNLLGNVYYALQEYDKALINYKISLQLKKYSRLQEDSEMAEILANISNAYRLKDQYKEALKYSNSVVAILDKIYPGTDNRKLTFLVDQAVLLEKTGDLNQAIIVYDKATVIVSSLPKKDVDWITYLFKHKGNLYDKLGDIEKANSCYSYLLDIYNTNPDKYATELAFINHNLGIISYKKGNYIAALEHFQNSEISKRQRHLPEIGITYSGIASCYTQLGKNGVAEKYYQLAINNHRTEQGNHLAELASDYISYGIFCLNQGKTTKSKEYILKAIDISKRHFGANHPETAQNLSKLGDIYTVEGKLKDALAAYQSSIKASCIDFNFDDPLKNPEIFRDCYGPELLNAMKKKARLLAIPEKRKQDYLFNLKNSLTTYELCISLVHKMRNSYGAFESKVFFSNEERETYSEAVSTAMKLYHITKDNIYKEKAFTYAEKGKSSILQSSLRNRQAIQIGGIPDSLITFEQELLTNIETFQHLVMTENQKQKPEAYLVRYWNEQLFTANEKLQAYIRYLEKNFPDYYSLKYDDRTISPGQVSHKLKPKEALIEYFFTSDKILIFFAKSNMFDVIDINKPGDFDKKLGILRKYLENKTFYEQQPENFEQYLSIAFYLYQTLLKPVESLISNCELIIVPDDNLASIPFEVFLTRPVVNAREYNNLPYLIRKNPVGYAYSAGLLFENVNIPLTERNLKVAVFAPNYKKLAFNLSNDPNQESLLKPLPYAFEEANLVADFFNGKIYTGKSASKAKFKKSAGKYDVLHLTMHTIIDNKNPLYSKLAFTANPSKKDDGFLNTFELFNLRLNARMAVLSACNSGVGQIHKGEGMMSLARGFYYAGCPSVVMTLWPVEDQISSILIKSFYQNLSEGKDKLESLQAAKLKFLESADPLRSHPYFWASYVNIGDMSPIVQKPSEKTRKYYIVASIFGLFLLFLPLMRKIV